MEKALWDFAEAALGRNRDMRWSLSDPILRRQISPVFKRCASEELSPEVALDVAVDFVASRMTNTLEIFSNLYQSLNDKLGDHGQSHKFAYMGQLQEFFLGLNTETEWMTNRTILQREMWPLFNKVADGNVNQKEALTIFCDSVGSKRDYYLELVYTLVHQLTEEILAYEEAKLSSSGPVVAQDPSPKVEEEQE